MKFVCPYCNFETTNSDEFEGHLKYFHFLDYKSYCEIELMSEKNEDYFCYRCKKFRSPLTLIIPELYHLPCFNCFSTLKKSEKIGSVQTILRAIKEYYDRLVGDRYLQLFLINDTYFNFTVPHTFFNFKSMLGELTLPSRNDLWLIDWDLGFPKLICEENIKGLKVINLSSLYNINSEVNKITINEKYDINLPELITYDVSHHCRYSILNKTSNRKTKRLRISDSDKCIKFNNGLYNFKSIFKITDSNTGEVIDPFTIDKRDLMIIKMVILRNKIFIRKIYDIIYEFLKVSGKYRDGVFLKNTVTIDPEKDFYFNFTWIPDNNIENNNFINISIL